MARKFSYEFDEQELEILQNAIINQLVLNKHFLEQSERESQEVIDLANRLNATPDWDTLTDEFV